LLNSLLIELSSFTLGTVLSDDWKTDWEKCRYLRFWAEKERKR